MKWLLLSAALAGIALLGCDDDGLELEDASGDDASDASTPPPDGAQGARDGMDVPEPDASSKDAEHEDCCVDAAEGDASAPDASRLDGSEPEFDASVQDAATDGSSTHPDASLPDARVEPPVCNSVAPTACASPPPLYADVEPIFMQRCVTCHAGEHGGESWPLNAYSHVVSWAAEIRSAMLECWMPPLDSGMTMLDEERDLILMWLRCGAPM